VFFGFEERRIFGSVEQNIERCFIKVFESGEVKIFSLRAID